ncbi:MAG TPA: TRAM domain-containing protein, partial [Pseudomonadales bacterium]|nr:TRAM domain-containing protein [Pseudomonadales bacterium]
MSFATKPMHKPKKKAAVQQAPVEARIEKLSHDGRGITHINGKTVFVENALPGELVELQIVNRHGRFDEARAIDVIFEAPERVEPPCAHADICGGCSLQFLNSDAQVELKESVLREQLKHFGGLEPKHWLPPLRSETEGYRHKARLGAKYVFKKNT